MSTPNQPVATIPTPLRQAFIDCAASRLSGVLRVTGQPGGAFHFSEGKIVAGETPGAPGIEAILLRSKRVDESGWDAAFAAAAATGREMRNELIGRELVGAGELEALLRTTIADAVFAVAYGVVEICRAEAPAAGLLVTLEPGAEAEWLLAETSRRIRVLRSFTDPVFNARARVIAVTGAVRPGLVLGEGRDELAALADGRRTPRDLAFVLGRGVYATMLELGRMQADGLILADSRPPGSPADDEEETPSPAVADDAETPGGLPRRRREHAGQGGRAGGRDLPAAFRLLRLRYGEGTSTGGTG
jgi:hypothetical protein